MRALIDVLFVVLVVSLSFTPLICLGGWDGYAPESQSNATFVYRNETCYILYSDETIRTDKPHIFLLREWPIRGLVDLVELSDRQSFVYGLNLYEDFESHGGLVGDELIVSYESNHGGLRLTKSIWVTGEGVLVTYGSDQPIELRVTLWRWYFSAVDGCDYRGVPQPLRVEPKDTLRFEFEDEGQTYRGVLKLSNEPSNVQVGRDLNGINKILIDYVGSHLSIKITLESASRSSFKIANKNLLFPLISIVFGAMYLKVGRYAFVVKIRSNRTGH